MYHFKRKQMISDDEVPRVSVVIPTLNEAANICHVLPFIPTWVHEILIVDGYSTDNTINVCRDIRPDAHIIMQEGRGKGSALRTGFKYATGDVIVMLDADGSTDPREIPRYVAQLMNGADFVKGSRFLQGGGTSDMTFIRRLGNWGLTMFVRLLFGGRYTDLCYGYNAFWTWVVPILNLDGTGFEIETMMNIRALKAKLNVYEVPSFEYERVYGVSRLNAFKDGLRVLRTILAEWIRIPERQAVRQRRVTVMSLEAPTDV